MSDILKSGDVDAWLIGSYKVKSAKETFIVDRLSCVPP